MSRLLQALKSLEARPARSVRESGPLAHLADALHVPSPDPPPSTHGDSLGAGQPSPINPPPSDHPLLCLSSGLPTIFLDTASPPVPQFSPESIAPQLSLDLVPSASPEIVPSPPPALAPARAAADLLLDAPHYVDEVAAPRDTLPPETPPSRLTKRITESLPSSPTRPPTILERAVRRTLAEPERSEPFRQLADRLKADLDQVAGRSILLTGVGPASETHDVILSAAAVLAEAGQPILVIDGDAAHHMLTSQLDLGGTGLAELAHGQEPDSDPICATALANLFILPMGRVRLPDPASVANRLAALVQSLEGAFRLVVIDGGRTSDRAAAALARLCDATYFVVRLGETDTRQAQTALRDFRAVGARLLGCIATT